MSTTISVFADWEPLPHPRRIGRLHVRRGVGKELFEFEFTAEGLAMLRPHALSIDPRLGLFEGLQHPPQGRSTFGVFADASPDRWGRLLMRRRLERDQRAGLATPTARLLESDYLLGVHDEFRVGALRFQVDDADEFVNARHDVAAPPFVKLRELEAASLSLERDADNTAVGADKWLRMLLAPGGSLGGARPKASVVDPDGRLWIAKFPSVRDEHDIGGWEMIVHTLAKACGVNVPLATARRFTRSHHTFLVDRFDRTSTGRRLHFASAMTLTGHEAGDDASTGASYLELAEVLIAQGAQPKVDLEQLWTRIVFNMLVSNTDDHLRNHGFILVPNKGWRLSDAFDLNPAPGSDGLRLNISQSDNALDLELARSQAAYFRVGARTANAIIDRSKAVVAQWPKLADSLKIPREEQERMTPAFALAAGS